jgi:hypothetical protein
VCAIGPTIEQAKDSREHTIGNDDDGGDSSDSSNEPSDDESDDLCEAQELFENIKDIIASLFRLAVMIRNSTTRDRYAQASGSREPFMREFDIAHVGEKFPKLNTDSKQWLKERIGTAITQRRQYLRYTKDHRYKLGKGPAELWKPTIETPKAMQHLLVGSQAARTNTSKPVTTLADTTASTLFLQEATQVDVEFCDNQSQTSFAFSQGGEENQERLQLPRISEVSNRQASFECPFCWTIQTIRRESAWRKHALADLRPYVCTFGSCDLKLFVDRKTWFEHEMNFHRSSWHCHFCGRDDFMSSEAFRDHVHDKHAQNVGGHQLEALADASKRPIEFIKASDCPFCDSWEDYLRKISPTKYPANEPIVVNPRAFRGHVGSHMQGLALFAIPRGYLEGDTGTAEAASNQAAGAGKDSASVANSRSVYSEESYTSIDEVSIPRPAVDVQACSKLLLDALTRPSPAFEEALLDVLPALDSSELHELKDLSDISQRISQMEGLYHYLVAATWDDLRWLHSFSANESIYPLSMDRWLHMVSHMIIDRTLPGHLDDSTLLELDDRAKRWMGEEFGQSWLAASLHHVATCDNRASTDPVTKENIIGTVHDLRTRLIDNAASDDQRQSTMSWYLKLSNRTIRRLFRTYAKLYPGEDLCEQLSKYFNEGTVSCRQNLQDVANLRRCRMKQ